MATTKKAKVSDEPVAEHDTGVFEALDEVQQKLDRITDQRSDEILAVERRYNEIRRPVYLERNKLMRDVPDLWLQCLLQHQQIAELVSERDTDVLSFLEEVDVEDFPDIKSGYKITFAFKDNPFFRNRQLVKELHYADDNALAIQGTDIDWTEEGLQHQEQAQQELVNGRKRKAEEATSFFDWFWDSGEVPEGNDPISDLIKDELWANPMRGGTEETQDGEGPEPGSEEEDTGMYTEEYTEQYEYGDDAAGQEGEDDLQGSELLTSEVPADTAEIDLQDANLQDEGNLAEADVAIGAEGNDDDAEEAAAPADYPEGDADASGAAADPATNGVPASSGPDDNELQKSSAGVLMSEDGKTAQKA